MLTVGMAAKVTGLRASAIRYYERHGLLRPSRLVNGYRVYDEETIQGLRFLRQAQSLGFSLKEIKQLLDVAHHGQRPCKRVREVARQHLADIDLKIRELRYLHKRLSNLLTGQAPASGDELCPLISSGALLLQNQKRPTFGD